MGGGVGAPGVFYGMGWGEGWLGPGIVVVVVVVVGGSPIIIIIGLPPPVS